MTVEVTFVKKDEQIIFHKIPWIAKREYSVVELWDSMIRDLNELNAEDVA